MQHNVSECTIQSAVKTSASGQRTYYPMRKTIGIFGFLFLTLSAFLIWRFMDTRYSYHIFPCVLTIPVSVYLLGPFFRNPVVDIEGNTVILHSFRKRYSLRPEDFEETVHDKNGAISYCFFSEKGAFRITPRGYHDGGKMGEDFIRIFGESVLQ